MNYSPSLLAPARDYDTAIAAIQAGADAVYIGAPRFGARQAAGNSINDIRRLVRYAHPFGVKVLVTLNTLLSDDELPQAVALAWELYHAGADALIIQDLQLLRQDLPPIRLHASTQCDNRTPEHVARLRDLGFARVVLARELSLGEIQAIHNAVPDIELEAFVHGALCVSYSGRCYLSEHLTGRSANRGACAQMCRLPYDLLDADGHILRDDNGQPLAQRYALSLQDLDRSASLAQLIQAGVTTFKIEGRLKDAAYVTNITAYYRRLLNDLLNDNQQPHPITFYFTPDPAKTFHRGATDYFLHTRNPHMANWLTPKSTGEPVGTAIYAHNNRLTAKLLPDITLHNGDGLTIADQGFAINGATPDTRGQVTITLNKPLPILNLPQPLFRNLDNAFLRTLRAERRIPIDITLTSTPDGYSLTMTSPVATATTAITEPHVPADNAERASSNILQQLAKLGDTPFLARHINIQLPHTPFIPIARLNLLRRNTAEALLLQEPPIPQQPTRPRHAPTDAEVAQQRPRIDDSLPLMTCRYCILHELGHCRKHNPMTNEPRFLRLANGTQLALRFNCQRCEMTIHQSPNSK